MPKIHSWTSHRTEKAFLYHKKHATPVVPQLMILMDFSKFEQKIVHQNVHLLFNKEVGCGGGGSSLPVGGTLKPSHITICTYSDDFVR